MNISVLLLHGKGSLGDHLQGESLWMDGWMDGWLDGWINRSITKHTLTSIHRSILHLPDHFNMPNLEIRIYHSGRLFWAPGEGSSTTTPSGVIGDCETVQFCVFSPHFFSTHGKKTMEKATHMTNDMYVCTYIYIYAFLPFTFFVFVCKSSYITWGPSCFRQELLRSKRIPQEALYQLKTYEMAVRRLVVEMEGKSGGKITWWDRKYKKR